MEAPMSMLILPPFLVLTLFVQPVAVRLHCFVGTFREQANEIGGGAFVQKVCGGFCYSRYANDGMDILFELGCDENGELCRKFANVACMDDLDRSEKVCCCSHEDGCVAEGATRPIEYPLRNLTLSSATAAYQIEGGAREHRSPSVWDIYSRRPNLVANTDTGDTACDSYHRWHEDVALLRGLGVDQYRFSISWTRILLDGTPATRNPVGIAYYHALLDALLGAGVTPVVTMYHWDLPQTLMDAGGWLNPDTAHAFAQYADVLFREFGQKVKMWIPINEPLSVLQMEYCDDFRAAAAKVSANCEWTFYLAAKNLLLAHGQAWHKYKALEGTAFGGGQLGFALNGHFALPHRPHAPEDRLAAERVFDFTWGLFAHPVFSADGDWPPLVQERLQKLSQLEGRFHSRLPKFQPHERKMLAGSADFVGVNFYTSAVSTLMDSENADNLPFSSQFDYDSGTRSWAPETWRRMNASNPWILYTPFGLRALMRHLDARYPGLPILITENGCMDNFGEGLQDRTRVHYLRGHLMAVSQARAVDRVNVLGYTVWSLMDNFEWLDGYTTKFGIHHVDFSSPNRTRTPKASADFFKQTIAKRSVTGFSPDSRY